MTTKHTPGQWRAYEMASAATMYTRWRVGDAACIAGIALSGNDKTDEFRARLIAEAPAMLEALRAQESRIAALPFDVQVACDLDGIRAILARIEGA